MRTSETLLLDFIRQSPQFRIPVNQRRFAWTQRECRQLWEDTYGNVARTRRRVARSRQGARLPSLDTTTRSAPRQRSRSATAAAFGLAWNHRFALRLTLALALARRRRASPPP